MNDDKKIIAEIEKISKEYWEKLGELKMEQNEVVREYILKLEEKKKEELMKKFV
jgi:gamma-glutamylcyclotransferase (GGCT)/AIG2-like uncharacterized protein YtfP